MNIYFLKSTLYLQTENIATKQGDQKMQFYLVTAKCGHVGKTSYMPITFPVKAENGKEAAKKVRAYPRVKRNHWDAILGCKKVDEQTYLAQIEINNNDPYLHATSKQEQKRMVEDIQNRIKIDNHQNELKQLAKKSLKPNLRYQSRKYVFDIDGYYEMCSLNN